jgi:hypothetical protein
MAASRPQSFLRSLAVVLAPTLVIGLVSYAYATLDNRRKDQLEFVRGQIVDLYGPLYTLSAALDTVWGTLGRKHAKLWQDVSNPPNPSQLLHWRKLLESVIEPMNDQIEKALLSSKQTIRCPATRDALHEFVAFAESMKLVIVTWKSDEDLSDKTKQGNVPEVPYPKNLSDLLSAELTALHEREKTLESDFFGLFVWGSVPECAANPAPTLKELAKGATQASR